MLIGQIRGVCQNLFLVAEKDSGFDQTTMKRGKMTKTEQLNELFGRWKEHWQSYGIGADKFSPDGIINEESYQGASIKLLFILRESNTGHGKGIDIKIHLGDNLKWIIWHQLAKWAFGILNNFERPFEDVNNSYEEMRAASRQIAVMNLKKYTGGSSVDYSLLNAFAFLDSEFIREEIDIIEPEVIVCCNTFIETMWALDLVDVKKSIQYYQKLLERYFEYKQTRIVAFPHHPADRKSHEANYNELRTLFKKIGLV